MELGGAEEGEPDDNRLPADLIQRVINRRDPVVLRIEEWCAHGFHVSTEKYDHASRCRPSPRQAVLHLSHTKSSENSDCDERDFAEADRSANTREQRRYVV